jgi:tetratricopeptide (TPR) repeat protein
MYNYWDRMNRNGLEAFDVSAAKMQAQADKLEQLAPTSVEALLAKARSAQLELDWPTTLALYKDARDRFPGSVDTNTLYGTAVGLVGHLQEGLAIIEAGAKLDPLSVEALIRYGIIAYRLGNCSELQHVVERALELSPEVSRVRGYMGYCLLNQKDGAEQALTWLAQEPIGFIRYTGNAIALHRLGRHKDAARELTLLQEDSGEAAAFQYAQIHAQWGETGQALDWLQKALDVHDPGVLLMGIDHFLDPVRQEPRFQELLQQAGLADCCELQE